MVVWWSGGGGVLLSWLLPCAKACICGRCVVIMWWEGNGGVLLNSSVMEQMVLEKKQSARKSVGLLAACGASVVLALAGALGQK